MSATLTPRLLLGAPTAWTSFLPYLVQLGPTYCCLLSRTVLSIHYSLTMHVRVASAGRLGQQREDRAGADPAREVHGPRGTPRGGGGQAAV